MQRFPTFEHANNIIRHILLEGEGEREREDNNYKGALGAAKDRLNNFYFFSHQRFFFLSTLHRCNKGNG